MIIPPPRQIIQPHDAVKSLRLTCQIGAAWTRIAALTRWEGLLPMKRSRRVVLTMMGNVAVGAVSMGLVPYDPCGPGRVAVRTSDGRILCRATYGGFGGTFFHLHHHGHDHGHGHAGG
jgi:hypothetical protein